MPSDARSGQDVRVVHHGGGGKSTLLNIIGGLDSPTSGEVRFEDHATARENVALVTEIASRMVCESQRGARERRQYQLYLHRAPSARFGNY